jgi:hypothetical protein
MSGKTPPSDRRPPASAAEAAHRLAAIVDAAERAASTVIDDAEEQARRHLEEAHIRADRIVAEHLRGLADELDPPAPSGEERTTHLKPVEPIDEPAEFAGDPSVGRGGEPSERTGDKTADAAAAGGVSSHSKPAAARLLATQMAVSGASREEIDRRLRSGLDIQDTSEILDAILGRED